MNRPARALLAAGGAALAVVMSAVPAAADPDDTVNRVDETIEIGTDGVAHVTLDLEMDFGADPNHGPYLTFLVKQPYGTDHDRIVRITDVGATSPSGAASDLDAGTDENNDAWFVIRIGDPDRDDVTGVQTYTVTFDAEGWVNPAGYPFPDGTLTNDEVYLNVLTEFESPVAESTVTLTGPADVLAASAYVDEPSVGSATFAGRTAAFRATGVAPYGDLTVAAAFPAGTFEAEPIIQDRWSPATAFALTPGTGLATGLVGLLGAGLAIGRARRRGRDEQFLGLTPGLQPASGQESGVGPRRRAPVAVQFQPPMGFHAGQLGTLVDETADPRDVTATIIDLAVRGYVLIQQVDEPGGRQRDHDWRLVRTPKPADDLLEFEHTLLDSLFDDRPAVLLSDLKTTFATSMAAVQRRLYEDVTGRGWFRGDPRKVRTAWIAAGVLLLVGGLGVTVLLAAFTSWGLVGLPLAGVGLLVMGLSRVAPARTATGTAVLAEAEGFRLYLATAEAAQLRFEEGEDLFSRYLPYAVAFDLTERWTRIFSELAAQGRDLPTPAWYLGSYGGPMFWASGATFGHDLSQFTAVAATAISAPTPGSSGGSGISGGFSGGGMGGGGGGGW
ncbi:MAG: DUF2207 domain-containing protein [Cellulomonadaceae bacterium]|nr:DUF2207 domain-containing protein [Cellulomonadaceae bacterium]